MAAMGHHHNAQARLELAEMHGSNEIHKCASPLVDVNDIALVLGTGNAY